MRMRSKKQATLREKPRGLYALYLHYCYLLGVIPKVIPKNPEAYAAIKEDVRRARMYSEQAKFLGKYGLDTKDDLIQHALGVREQMNTLCKERQKLRNKMRWMKDPAEMQPIREQIFVGCIDLPSIVPKHTYKLYSRQGVAIEYLPSAV